MMHELLVVDLLETLSSEVQCNSSAEGWGGGHGKKVNDILKPWGGPTALPRLPKEARRRTSGMEIPQTVGGRSANVVLETLQLVASSFTLGQDMIAGSQMLGTVALLGQVKEPRGLLRLMVALKPSSEEGLVGHFPDGRPASAKRILLSALMAEVGEIEDSQFNSSPVRLPEPVKVASLDS